MSDRWSRFVPLWLGQSLAMFGVGLTAFTVGVALLEGGHRTSAYTTLVALTTLPAGLLGPLASTFAERWQPRTAVAVALLVPGTLSLVLAALLATQETVPWLVYPLLSCAAVAASVHWPAYVKASTVLVPRSVARTAGLMQLGMVAQRVVAPGAAAGLLAVFTAPAVLTLDAALALVGAVTVLAIPSIPSAPRTSAWQMLREGLAWLGQRSGLVAYLGVVGTSYAFGSVLVALGLPLLLVLGTTAEAGVALTVAGAGMVLGILAAAAWAPRRAVVPALMMDGLSAPFLIAMGLAPSIRGVAIAAFGFLFTYGLHAGLSQSVWQARIPVPLQARVFAVRAVALFGLLPFVYLALGPATELLDPAQTGFGIRALLVVGGLGKCAALAVGALLPALRNLEDDVPSTAGTV